MKRFFLKFTFLVLVPVLGIEAIGRLLPHEGNWYEIVEHAFRPSPQPIFVVGSSRAASAIETKAFSDTLRLETGKDFTLYNFGRGDASLAMHYFGLRRLLTRHPNLLKNAVVLFETTEGVPQRETWEGSWIVTRADLLPSLLSWSDLPRYWASQSPDQIHGTLSVLFRTLPRLETFRAKLIHDANDRLTAGYLAVRQNLKPLEPVQTGPTIQMVAGIRTDPRGIAEVRAILLKRFADSKEAREHQVPQPDLEDTFQAELVKANGGTPAFFEIPTTSVSAYLTRTPIGRQDREAFLRTAKQWGTPVLKTDFAYDDSDFPDLSHLTPKRAPEFARLLAQAVVKHGLIAPKPKPIPIRDLGATTEP